jgi:hypothetical protein
MVKLIIESIVLRDAVIDDLSAVKLQSVWRGYRVRRNILPKENYNLAKLFLAHCPCIEEVPRASSGITKVYLPPELSVVLKQSGKKGSEERFFIMCSARDFCLRKGYKQLVIPRALPYGEYNIEDRIPIKESKQKGQIGLYCEYKAKFTLAVQEFTKLLCQAVYPDILTLSHPYQRGPAIPWGRYDNIPLFLEGDMGKIGLIDLQDFHIREERPSKEELIVCTKTAICIFPYHLEEILAVLVDMYSEMEPEKPALEVFGAQVIHQFNMMYIDHRKFVERKGIKIEEPGAFFPIPATRKAQIQEVALKTAAETDLLEVDHEIIRPWLEEVISVLIETTFEQIRQALVKAIEEAGSIDSNIDLLSARNLTLKFKDISACFYQEQRVKTPSTLISSHLDSIAKFVITTLFEELGRGEELAFANLYVNRTGEHLVRIHC